MQEDVKTNWTTRHICKYLKKEQRETYYNGVVKSVLMYGSTIWSSSNKENMTRLFKIQKRAARSILMADRDTRSITLSNALKLDSILQRNWHKKMRISF